MKIVASKLSKIVADFKHAKMFTSSSDSFAFLVNASILCCSIYMACRNNTNAITTH